MNCGKPDSQLRRSTWIFLAATLAIASMSSGRDAHSQARPADNEVLSLAPPELAAYAGWVTRSMPELGCPWTGSGRQCVWPSHIELTVSDGGARFSLYASLSAAGVVQLPGDRRWWPQNVRVGGRAISTFEQGSAPAVRLPAGRHRIDGALEWSQPPERLPLPGSIAVVMLRRGDEPWQVASRTSDNQLRLSRAQRPAPSERATEADSLDVEVYRLLVDTIPQRLETRLQLRVSGAPRSQTLESTLPEGFHPNSVESPLPTTISADGDLQIELRPGTWWIKIQARDQRDISSFSTRQLAEPWPQAETWFFNASTSGRSIESEDARRYAANLSDAPPEWASFPAFRLRPEQQVHLRTNYSEDAPEESSKLHVYRELRMAFDGSSFQIRDNISATDSNLQRLNIAGQSQLNSATINSQPVAITRHSEGGADGIELRAANPNIQADIIHQRSEALSAIGWRADAELLNVELHLPPGWVFIAAEGADMSPTAWIFQWQLLDVFLLLIFVLGVRAIYGNKLAALTCLALLITWNTNSFPLWRLLIFLASAAIITALAARSKARVAWFMHSAITLVMLFGLAEHASNELSGALFPALDHPYKLGSSAHLVGSEPSSMDHRAAGPPRAEFARMAAPAPQGMAAGRAARAEEMYDEEAYEQEEMAADAEPPEPSALRAQAGALPHASERSDDSTIQLQTGRGVPTWQWRQHSISWNGPVAADQELRLLLLPPVLVGALRILSVLALCLAIGLMLLRQFRLAAGSTGAPTTPKRKKRKRKYEQKESGEETPSERATREASLQAQTTLIVASIVVAATAIWTPQAHASPFPPQTLLDELRQALSASPSCFGDCAQTASLLIEARGDSLTLRAEVHSQTATVWSAPGPLNQWTPTDIRINGLRAEAMRRNSTDILELAVPRGVSQITLSGALTQNIALALPRNLRALRWESDGWLLDGYRPDTAPPQTVYLSRAPSDDEPVIEEPDDTDEDENPEASSELTPVLELSRRISLHNRWDAEMSLTRRSAADDAIMIRIPLLEGESLLSDTVEESDGFITASLGRGESRIVWRSSLTPRESLSLEALDEPGLSEQWSVTCSELWDCNFSGLPPSRVGSAQARWAPRWSPWPGQQITVDTIQPRPVDGQTLTVDNLWIETTDGARLRDVLLRASVRANHGGQWSVTIPDAAEVQLVSVNGQELRARPQDGVLTIPVATGTSSVMIEWRLDTPQALASSFPELSLPGGAVDVTMEWRPSSRRWLIWAQGPTWGPTLTIWYWLPTLLIIALLLGRFAPTPIRAHSWLLLGLGMTQVPIAVPAIIVAWLLVIGLRAKVKPKRWWTTDLFTLGLALLTFIAAIALSIALWRGLALRPPDMQVMGGNSHNGLLRWYSDRVESDLPAITLISVPLWVWHATMLAWALWLAASVVRWLRWGWGVISVDKLWLSPPWRTKKASADPSDLPDEL